MSQGKLKVAFLDRDGVINKKPKKYHYVLSVEDFKFNEGIFEELLMLKSKGYSFIVVTNQRCVSLRLITSKKLQSIHKFMLNEFSKKDIQIKDVLFCPHGIDKCFCRKPKTGLLELAFSKYNIDKQSSFFVGDSEDDKVLAQNFGIRFIDVLPDQPEIVSKVGL